MRGKKKRVVTVEEVKGTCASARIRHWATRHFAAQYVDSVTQGLIDVAAGNRQGNSFEIKALAKIFPDWKLTLQE